MKYEKESVTGHFLKKIWLKYEKKCDKSNWKTLKRNEPWYHLRKKNMGLENYSKEDKEYLETIWKLRKRDGNYLTNEIRLETI